MPTSFHGQISSILNIISELKPDTILDIGVGFGKYGVLLRDLLDIPYERYEKEMWKVRIDGIEGYGGYENPIHTYAYNKIYYERAEKAIHALEINYDLIMMIDILEHFEKTEGEKFINDILKKCKYLIVAVPAIPCPQKYLDNSLEEHKAQWDANDFLRFSVIKSGFVPMGKYNSSIIALLKGEISL